MINPTLETVICIRCGHRWTVDLTALGKPTATLYKGDQRKTRVETFRLVCPNDGTVNMLDVTFEEARDA